MKAVRTPTHVKYLTEKGLFVWSVACGSAHTAITTRIEVQQSTDSASDGATNVVGGLVLVTGAAWALGREQLNKFAIVKEFKKVRFLALLHLLPFCLRLMIIVCVCGSCHDGFTASREASVLWVLAHCCADVRGRGVVLGL